MQKMQKEHDEIKHNEDARILKRNTYSTILDNSFPELVKSMNKLNTYFQERKIKLT